VDDELNLDQLKMLKEIFEVRVQGLEENLTQTL